MSEELVLEALRKENSQLLLILDNFDHLLPDGVVVLEQMLVKAPRLRCVVTSRDTVDTLGVAVPAWRIELSRRAWGWRSRKLQFSAALFADRAPRPAPHAHG